MGMARWTSAVGRIRVPFHKVKGPKKLLLTVAIDGTPYRNSYDLWVYPPRVDTTTPANVIVTDRLDAAAQKHLDGGGKVTLSGSAQELLGPFGALRDALAVAVELCE